MENVIRAGDSVLSTGVPVIKIGDPVYLTDGIRIYESKVRKFIYETDIITFDASAIGAVVFLSRDEAEKGMNRLREKSEKETNGRAREW